MPTTESFYAIVFRVFVCICFPCTPGHVMDMLVNTNILTLLEGRSGGSWTWYTTTGEELLVTLSLICRGRGNGSWWRRPGCLSFLYRIHVVVQSFVLVCWVQEAELVMFQERQMVSPFCELEQLPPFVDLSGFFLPWTQATSSIFVQVCLPFTYDESTVQCRPSSWQDQIFLFNPGVL